MTKPMSEMTDVELSILRDTCIRGAENEFKGIFPKLFGPNAYAVSIKLILANQYDAELTLRNERRASAERDMLLATMRQIAGNTLGETTPQFAATAVLDVIGRAEKETER